jgi:hypothetical protein
VIELGMNSISSCLPIALKDRAALEFLFEFAFVTSRALVSTHLFGDPCELVSQGEYVLQLVCPTHDPFLCSHLNAAVGGIQMRRSNVMVFCVAVIEKHGSCQASWHGPNELGDVFKGRVHQEKNSIRVPS